MDFRIVFILVIYFARINCQLDLYFTKTLDGELFHTNLLPSLAENVSYIKAVDLRNNPITYSIISYEFIVDSGSGKVFLVSRLNPNLRDITFEIKIEIRASNGFRNITSFSRIRVINSDENPPEFIKTQNLFEIEEENLFPINLKYKNGSNFELLARNPYPLTNGVNVKCENLPSHPNSCEIFTLAKNELKTNTNEWYGSILALQKLDYVKQSIYMFILVASNSGKNTKKLTIQVKVLPSLKKAAQLSSSSYFFSVSEKQPKYTFIGQLSLYERYDLDIQNAFLINLVNSSEELIRTNIVDQDVNFEIVRKYLLIDGNNKLFTISEIDRDSLEIQNLNGIIKAWVKVYHKTRADIFNYFKINILVEDLNDNEPRFSIINQNKLINQFSDFPSQISFYSTIKENEPGPVLLNKLNTNERDTQIIMYDLDLGENSTIELQLNSYQPKNALDSCKPNTLEHYFQLDNLIESKSSLNFVNKIPFDFDTLNILPSFDVNGIAYKNLNISVMAQETKSIEKFKSKPLSITLKIQDTNDNKPILSQDNYYAYIRELNVNSAHQFILRFDVSDNDIGIFGIEGLKCFLLGQGSEK
ncbi:unnamed protein product [Brachionus calyciflorus]|uniref:Cadherin domain-containing protein n=1 Tax=Brachionus calyciflorus TaxID=104777 RepID=A0A813ULA2_9BILA|nr:unnamed protein product [Brachionus calyciflorus]